MEHSTIFADRLASCGLAEYSEAFQQEGFDTWEAICEIKESDLEYFQMKLGHRRKLFRAIRESTSATNEALGLAQSYQQSGKRDSFRAENEEEDYGDEFLVRDGTINGQTRTKRKYKRHPKPDPYAPRRPPSAYVLFAGEVRERRKDEGLDFTAMAKVVGIEWQSLTAAERAKFENEANANKEAYIADLTEYRRTEQFAEYRQYVAEFKQKQDSKESRKSARADSAASAPIEPDRGHSRSGSIESKRSFKPPGLPLSGSSHSLSPRSPMARTPYATNYSMPSRPVQSTFLSNERTQLPVSTPNYFSQRSGSDPYTRSNTQLGSLNPSSMLGPSPSHIYQSHHTPNLDFGAPGLNTQPGASASFSSTWQNQHSSQRTSDPFNMDNPKVPRLPPLVGSNPPEAFLPKELPPVSSISSEKSYGGDMSHGRGRAYGNPQPKDSHPALQQGNYSVMKAPQSPHSGRQVDGVLTPPPRLEEARSTQSGKHPNPFDMHRELSTSHSHAEALLDPDQMESYQPKPNVSEIRSRSSPRPSVRPQVGWLTRFSQRTV